MTLQINDGGPAFPVPEQDPLPGNMGMANIPTYTGMKLRDYFAAKAMQGLMSDSELHPDANIPEISYRMADEMIAERSKKRDQHGA